MPADPASLAAMLDQLREEFIQQNPKSAKAFQEAVTVLPGGNTRTVLFQDPFPIVLESGNGTIVNSLDGHQYVDFVSEYSAAMFGHSHPAIHAAVQEALSSGMNLGSVIRKEAEFGKLIQSRFPIMELLRFTNSGTEANMLTIAAALSHTERKEVLVFGNGYHGSTLSFPGGQNLPLNLPHAYSIGKYNDIERSRELLHPGIGAIIVEPLQFSGGLIPATKEFLQFLRDEANKLRAVLIFDEIVTSRFHYHGFQGLVGIEPDMTTLGKYLGGGFSFGCFGGKKEIMSRFDPRSPNHLTHSGTFNNNMFTMSAGIAGFKLVTPEEIERINRLGERVRSGVNAYVKEKCPSRLLAMGYGSAAGLHFPDAEGNKLKDIVYFELLKKGFLIGRRGFVMLNLAHTDEHVDKLLSALFETLDSLAK